MNELKITGTVVEWQTDIKTGLLVPGTMHVGHNAIQDALRKYLAHVIASGTVDKALDDLFATQGSVSSVGSTNSGKDGIAYGVSDGTINNFFVTTLNAGGDGNETYVEFYGYIDGPINMTDSLLLGHDFEEAIGEFVDLFATYSINTSVASGRRYHFYWKITIS